MKANHITIRNYFTRPLACGPGMGARIVARWHSINLVAAILGFVGFGMASSLASDPIGIYAIVDKVVFEPDDKNPERVQVWGAFAVAEGYGYTYKNAERGYLYYKLNPDKPNVCRNEWNDLKSVAGTGQIVAFGSRHAEKGKLRKKDAKPQDADAYPVAMGLKKIREERDYEPVKQLARLRDAKGVERGDEKSSEKR